MQNVSFHDYKPATLSLFDAVVSGLSQENKAIPPKFFYDKRGSHLFEKICEQPEYYPPAVERKMLELLAGEIAGLAGQERLMIEPGAGSAAKARLLLDELKPIAFVPMDISFDFLKLAATQLAKEYPRLPIHAACVDYTHSLPIPEQSPTSSRLLFFPGSSLGNFNHSEAHEFLSMVRNTVKDDGMLLIGVDTKKAPSLLNAAYNDAAGFTAQFNLNLLHRIRNELDAELDIEAFQHKAFYNSEAGRIEMYLVSLQQQVLRINGHSFSLGEGESIHTENSYKYSPQEFISMSSDCGFKEVRHWLDSNNMFGIYLLESA